VSATGAKLEEFLSTKISVLLKSGDEEEVSGNKAQASQAQD